MSRSGPRAATWRELLLVGLLAALCVLPFLGKAVHQDDWAYLTTGQLLVEHGPDVLDQVTIYKGTEITVAQGVLHGPVWMLVLAITQQLPFGSDGLLTAHLASALMTVLLAMSAAALAARLGARPVPIGVAAAISPVPMVLAGGFMTDLPMTALFTLAMALGVAGVQRASTRTLVAAGLVGVATALTRYHGLALVGLFAALPLFVRPFDGRRLGWRALLPATITLLGTLAGLVSLLQATGQWDALRAVSEQAKAEVDRNLALLAALGALGLSALAFGLVGLADPRGLARAAGRDRFGALLGMLGVGAGLFAAWTGLTAGPPAPTGVNLVVHWAAFAVSGLAVALGLRPFLSSLPLRDFAAWRARYGAAALLGLWCGGFLIAAWITVPFGSARYLLPAIPALYLSAGVLFAKLERGALATWVAAGVTMALGLVAGLSDARAAEVYRLFGRQVAEEFEGGQQAGRGWIFGDIDFRWYLEREAGLEVLATASDAPADGDRIYKSMICTDTASSDGSKGNYRLHPGVVRRMELAGERVFEDAFPFRVHNSYAPAGYYGVSGGLLPLAFSRAPHDVIQVWQIGDENRFLAGLDAARVEPWQGAKGQPRGTIKVERFIARVDQEQLLSISILFPGSVTYSRVPVPSGAALEVQVAEHERLSLEGIEGPASIARVRVNGEQVAELRLDTRRGEPQGWRPLHVDLSAWGGQRVDLTFELEAAEPGTPDKPPVVYVGFAEPRLVRARADIER